MSTLKATKRNIKENLTQIRNSGNLPAVFYGSGQASTPITINEKDFLKIYRNVGETGVIKLQIDGQELDSMIYDFQLHPVKHSVTHVDFRIVDANVAVEVEVPIEFTGESPIEKTNTGTINHVRQHLTVEALPNSIPSEINVDISVLVNLDSQILAKDIVLPSGVSLVDEPETVIAVVSPLREEDDSEDSEPIDMGKIEATKEKPKNTEE